MSNSVVATSSLSRSAHRSRRRRRRRRSRRNRLSCCNRRSSRRSRRSLDLNVGMHVAVLTAEHIHEGSVLVDLHIYQGGDVAVSRQVDVSEVVVIGIAVISVVDIVVYRRLPWYYVKVKLLFGMIIFCFQTVRLKELFNERIRAIF